jgi:hypothetical protein
MEAPFMDVILMNEGDNESGYRDESRALQHCRLSLRTLSETRMPSESTGRRQFRSTRLTDPAPRSGHGPGRRDTRPQRLKKGGRAPTELASC